MAREGTGTFFFNLQKSREAQYMKNLKTKRWCYTKQQLASEKKLPVFLNFLILFFDEDQWAFAEKLWK